MSPVDSGGLSKTHVQWRFCWTLPDLSSGKIWRNSVDSTRQKMPIWPLSHQESPGDKSTGIRVTSPPESGWQVHRNPAESSRTRGAVYSPQFVVVLRALLFLHPWCTVSFQLLQRVTYHSACDLALILVNVTCSAHPSTVCFNAKDSDSFRTCYWYVCNFFLVKFILRDLHLPKYVRKWGKMRKLSKKKKFSLLWTILIICRDAQ